MSTTINALRVRKVLGREQWLVPARFGPDGWRLSASDGSGSVIVTAAEHDGVEFVHGSMAFRDRLPTYNELCQLHDAVFGDGYAYQVFTPRAMHVNIHENALHLWGRSDGKPILPEFGRWGSI